MRVRDEVSIAAVGYPRGHALDRVGAGRAPVRRQALGLVVMLAVAGCQSAGARLEAPLYIKCKGTGKTNIILGPYAGTIQSECGEGFEYELSRTPPPR